MAYSLSNKCVKNICKQAVVVQRIVTYFFETQCLRIFYSVNVLCGTTMVQTSLSRPSIFLILLYLSHHFCNNRYGFSRNGTLPN